MLEGIGHIDANGVLVSVSTYMVQSHEGFDCPDCHLHFNGNTEPPDNKVKSCEVRNKYAGKPEHDQAGWKPK